MVYFQARSVSSLAENTRYVKCFKPGRTNAGQHKDATVAWISKGFTSKYIWKVTFKIESSDVCFRCDTHESRWTKFNYWATLSVQSAAIQFDCSAVRIEFADKVDHCCMLCALTVSYVTTETSGKNVGYKVVIVIITMVITTTAIIMKIIVIIFSRISCSHEDGCLLGCDLVEVYCRMMMV